MLIRVKTAVMEISIHNARWFYECMAKISEQATHLTLEFPKKTKVMPSGHALLELLSDECRTRQVTLQLEGVRYIPFKKFPVHEHGFSMDWFQEVLKPGLIDNFLERNSNDFTEDEAFDLRLLFSELTQNAKDHSGSEKFLVLLEKSGIGVFDLGVGVPAKLSQKYTFANDMEALMLSMKEGITTRRLRKGGLGLYYTLDLIKKNAGTLTFISGRAQLKRFIKSKKVDRKTLKTHFPGTLIYCELKTKKRKK